MCFEWNLIFYTNLKISTAPKLVSIALIMPVGNVKSCPPSPSFIYFAQILEDGSDITLYQVNKLIC
jgi:hypothetical protein